MGGRANSEALARAGKGSADDTYDTDLELAHAMSMQEFEFSSVHNGTFIALESAMHRSSRRLQYFCVSECLLTLVRWYYGKYPQALIGVANCLNHYTAATLIATGSKRFRKIYTTAGSDMHNLLRGLLQLSTVFHELSIISMALGILQIATAASIWKFVTVLVALFSVAVSGLRVITWHYPDWTLRCRHTFMRVRWLLSYHLRNCLRLATVKPDSDIPVSSALSEYELSRKQQQVIHRLIESMHVYGLACALQAASEVLLMAAFAHEGSVTAVLACVCDLADDMAISYCVLHACGSFDKAIASSSSPDLPHVLEGLGAQQGLAKLFTQFAQITLLLTVAQVAEAVLPLVVLVLFGTQLGRVWSSVIRISLDVLHVVV